MLTFALCGISFTVISCQHSGPAAPAQCECRTRSFSDGAIGKSCNTRVISDDNAFAVRITMMTLLDQYAILLTLEKKGESSHLSGQELLITLEDGTSLALPMGGSVEKTVMNDRAFLNGRYEVAVDDLNAMSASSISSIAFKTNDGSRRIYPVKQNGDILKINLKCLRDE